MNGEGFDGLHKSRFPYLSDEAFEEYLVECKRRGLDPWSKHLRAETYHDEQSDLPRLRMALTLEGYRDTAHATKSYAGCDDPLFVIGEEGRPSKATVTVYRLVRGKRMAFTASAWWDECAMYPLNDFWERRPRMALEYRARLAALREAFPDRFGGLWSPDELTTSGKETPKGRKPASKLADVKLAPDCRIQVEGEMVAMGYLESDARDRVIDSLIETFGDLYRADQKMFWGVALAALKKNPAQFGPVPSRKIG